MSKLNLGCGTDYRQGWINIDSGNVKVDIHHDLEEIPWPLETSSVDEVVMIHVLEHISRDKFIGVVRELYRVCKNNATINIDAPYAGSDNFWTDPTHKMPLTVRTFDFFDPSKDLHINGKIYGWGDIKFKVAEAKLVQNKPNGPNVVFKLKVTK